MDLLLEGKWQPWMLTLLRPEMRLLPALRLN
jgi:hypothetical protein